MTETELGGWFATFGGLFIGACVLCVIISEVMAIQWGVRNRDIFLPSLGAKAVGVWCGCVTFQGRFRDRDVVVFTDRPDLFRFRKNRLLVSRLAISLSRNYNSLSWLMRQLGGGSRGGDTQF